MTRRHYPSLLFTWPLQLLQQFLQQSEKKLQRVFEEIVLGYLTIFFHMYLQERGIAGGT